MKKNIIAIVQARMGSTRLPGKVMLDIAGKPMLVRDIERIQRAKKIDDIVVATTTKSEDDIIELMCHENEWNFYRGSETDLLDRYYQTAITFEADPVVRITSDCPLIEPAIIDQLIEKFLSLQPEIDYVSNIFPIRTYPIGLDAEVMSFSALKRCWKEDLNPLFREHVTEYILHNPNLFKFKEITNNNDLSLMRWTVDTKEDLEFVRRIYSHFKTDCFSWYDILALLREYPELQDINRNIKQKTV